MDWSVRRRSAVVLVVTLVAVLLPVGGAWAFWVVTAPALSSSGAAAQVPTTASVGCVESGDQGVTVSWAAAVPAAPAPYGYTANLAQTGPVWTAAIDTGAAVTTTLTPATLPTSAGTAHNGAVTVRVVTRYPQTGGAAWTSAPSTATVTFYQKTKYVFWIFGAYAALDCTP